MSVGSIFPTGPFLDPPPEYCDFESSRVCIVPVPYDATTSYMPGARFGPSAIIAASHQVELFDEQLERETFRVGIHTRPSVPPNTAGPEAMVGDIREECQALLNRGKFVVVLGGEHTVSLGPVDALRHTRGDSPFGVVQFDAHCDLREEYEGSRWSHACVAARMVEWGLPVVQVGVRAWSPAERRVDSRAPLISLSALELHRGDSVSLFEAAIANLPDDIYLTFDLDALDPSIMPATGTPEPGGLGWYDTLDLLAVLARRKKLIGIDVVELAPIAGMVAPDLLAARLVYRLIGEARLHLPATDPPASSGAARDEA